MHISTRAFDRGELLRGTERTFWNERAKFPNWDAQAAQVFDVAIVRWALLLGSLTGAPCGNELMQPSVSLQK